jgi:hypothetical protein
MATVSTNLSGISSESDSTFLSLLSSMDPQKVSSLAKEETCIWETKSTDVIVAGNTFLRNVNTGPDGVGYFAHRGPLLRKLNPTMKIVKQDPETLEPYRDPKTGFCVEVSKSMAA